MFVCCPPVTPDSQYVVIQMFILIHPRHTSATLLQVHSGSLLQLQKEKVQPNLLRGTIYSKPPHIQSWNMIYIYILLIASSNLKCSLSSKNYSFGLIVGSSLKCSLTSLISLILMLVTTTTCYFHMRYIFIATSSFIFFVLLSSIISLILLESF